MQYTKPMIELVYEIRRFVPSDMKPGVKLANPELFIELSEHYKNNAKTVTKALIKELFTLAGSEWVKLLTQQPEQRTAGYKVKSYRGVVSVEKTETHDDTPAQYAKPRRIYRGQVIA